MRFLKSIVNNKNALLLSLDTRYVVRRSITYSKLNDITDNFCISFNETGEPEKVLKYERTKFKEFKDMFDKSGNLLGDHIVIKNLAAPINPADLNYIQGIYGIKAQLPTVAGFEGIGRVTHVAATATTGVTSLSPGDVIAYNLASPPEDSVIAGTWRTHYVASVDRCWKIPDLLTKSRESLLMAATMSVNPCTAYRMLADFAPLQPGDCVIQNGATSAVGQAVIQLAKSSGVSTLNVIRASRDETTHRKRVDELMALGATQVVTDEFIKSKEWPAFLRSLKRKPSLFLNCVGGRQVADVSRALLPGSTIVTYGGMSMQPIMVGAGPLIFKDLRYRGYWMTDWNRKCNTTASYNAKREEMWQHLSSLWSRGEFTACRMSTTPLHQFSRALDEMKSPGFKKQVLVMDDELMQPL